MYRVLRSLRLWLLLLLQHDSKCTCVRDRSSTVPHRTAPRGQPFILTACGVCTAVENACCYMITCFALPVITVQTKQTLLYLLSALLVVGITARKLRPRSSRARREPTALTTAPRSVRPTACIPDACVCHHGENRSDLYPRTPLCLR